MRAQSVIRALDHLIEASWLLALVAIPIYFDTLTSRIFEPDKIVLFRNIVLVMVLCVLARAVVVAPRLMVLRARDDTVSDRPWWMRQVAQRPLLVPLVIFVLVYTAATVNSALPLISFWGSYDRMQGLYTWLSYITFFLILAYNIRSWAQIERIISALIFTTIPVSVYAIMQKLQWDPVQWGADTTSRVASTLGNSIFLGAYLIMCMPFIAYRIWRAIERMRPPGPPTPPPQQQPSSRRVAPRPRPQSRPIMEIEVVPPVVSAIGYGIILVLSFLALYFCGSRGPYYGFLAATVIIGFPLTIKWKNPAPALCSIALGIVLVVFPYTHVLNVFDALSHATSTGVSADTSHLTDFSDAGTEQVRLYIWQGSVQLIKQRPILGWGPEDMIYVYAPYYPSGLGHLERSNAAPDRNHDEWLDFLVFSGVIGLLAWLALLATFFMMVYKVWRRAQDRRAVALIAIVGGVVIGHLVEASVGIDIVSTLMLLWTMFALATVLYARPELLGERPAITASDTAPEVEPAPETNSRAKSRRRQSQRSGSRSVQTPTVSFDMLNGGQQSLLLILIICTLLATIGAAVLFVNNVRVVHADYVYKQGQQYDQVASICLNNPTPGGCPVQFPASWTQGQILQYAGTYMLNQHAIPLLQQATSEQSAQDMYYLWLGKGYLDQAQYYLTLARAYQAQAQRLAQSNPTQATTSQQYAASSQQSAVNAFQNAQGALLYAHNLNPYNGDHPMNLARMFSLWARYDPTKWAAADFYFRMATLDIARHNGRWSDEWGEADLIQAQVTGLTPAQRTAIRRQALAAFQHACEVDDLLGDARAFRGDAYQSLGQYQDAAKSYAEALKVGGFERVTPALIVQSMITALYSAHDYHGLVSPIYQGQSPITLAYSSTIDLNGPTSTFSQTLQQIVTTLRQKGYLK